jgi:hypothetical protein
MQEVQLREGQVFSEVEGDILTIKVKLGKGRPSNNSGKNLVLATTSGFRYVDAPSDSDVKISLNVIKPMGK